MKFKRLSLILVFLITFALVGCKNKTADSGFKEVNTLIDFSFYKQLAIDPSNLTNSYEIDGEEYNYSSVSTFLPVLGSNLAVKQSNTYGYYTLYNWKTGVNVSENIRSIGLYGSSEFRERYYVLYHPTLPIVAFGEYNSISSTYTIKYCDPYGKQIYIETANYLTLSISFTKTIDDTTYFVVSDPNRVHNICFQYTVDPNTNQYNVKFITDNDYSSVIENLEEEYNDGLVPFYDNKGNIIAYYTFNHNYGNLFIYDKNKRFLNNVSLSSFRLLDSRAFRLETKLVYYYNEEVKAATETQSGKPSYKTRLLVIDLLTGKIKFTDNYKYYIIDYEDYEFNNKYYYTSILFNELNNLGEKSDITKCAVLKNDIAITKSYIYDGSNLAAYKIDEKRLLVMYENNYYIVSEKGKKYLNGFVLVSISDNGDIIYKNHNNKYYMCALKDLESSYSNLNNGKDYISSSLYNGIRYSYSFNILENNYLVDNNNYKVQYNFSSLVDSGIFVTNNAVYIGEKKILEERDKLITYVEVYQTFNDGGKLYAVTYKNNRDSSLTYKYFIYTKKLTN